MTAFRLARLLLHLFEGLLTCALVFPLLDAAGRQARVKRWSARMLEVCGVRLRLAPAGDTRIMPHALVVSNHVSWLDIFVINALQPCRFVAKSDIRGWPLIGWLCEKAGTIFIARGSVRDVRRIYRNLVTSLHDGEHVAFFPEGTTAAQGRLLPFHANLFEAAIEAKVPVQPCALRYLDRQGEWHPAADFVGDMTFAQSVFAILRAPGIEAQLTLLPFIAAEPAWDRRALANAAHAAIGRALDAPGQPL